MNRLNDGKPFRCSKKIITVMFLIVIVLQASFSFLSFYAGASDSPQNNIGFYVKAELPQNQRDTQSSYFNLRMLPEQIQTINVQVINTTDNELNFNAKINDATTNSAGSVEYQFEGIRDKSLKYSLNDIAKIEAPDFTVPANSTYRMAVDLKMPKEEFSGELIGGIVVTKINDPNSQDAGMSINNVFSYVVGLRLTETDTPVLTELELTDVAAQTVNYRSAIVHSIRNISPKLLNEANMKIEIFKKGQKEPHWVHSLDMLKMAPSSLMQYNMYVDASTIQPGKYISQVTITNPDGKWIFEKEFEIDANDISDFKDVVNNSVYDNNDNIAYFLLIAAIIIILIILVLIYLIYKNVKQAKKLEKDKLNNE